MVILKAKITFKYIYICVCVCVYVCVIYKIYKGDSPTMCMVMVGIAQTQIPRPIREIGLETKAGSPNTSGAIG